jgi:transcriptional regulator GlxA family with amidase domain
MPIRSLEHTLRIVLHQASLSIERDGVWEPAARGNVVYLCVLGIARREQPDAPGRPPLPCRRVEPLQKWRLRRVTEYVDDHLGDRIRLTDMAAAAGLTRMHFAAQFRLATGQRPHRYVLQRRVDRARDLLRSTPLPLVEVALSVGFQTQSHFTTVFKRLTGETPSRWRRAARDCAADIVSGWDGRARPDRAPPHARQDQPACAPPSYA